MNLILVMLTMKMKVSRIAQMKIVIIMIKR